MKNKTSRWWPIVAVVLGGGLGLGLIVALGGAPEADGTPSPAETPDLSDSEAAREFILSDEFGKLPEDRRYEAFKKVFPMEPGSGGPPQGLRPWEMSEEQREAFRENVRPLFRRLMRERMDEYFAMSKQEKNVYLDKAIDDMNRFRKEREARRRQRETSGETSSTEKRPGPPRGDGERHRRGPSPDRMRRFIEKTDPEDRAKMMQFMKDLTDRVVERGGSPEDIRGAFRHFRRGGRGGQSDSR